MSRRSGRARSRESRRSRPARPAALRRMKRDLESSTTQPSWTIECRLQANRSRRLPHVARVRKRSRTEHEGGGESIGKGPSSSSGSEVEQTGKADRQSRQAKQTLAGFMGKIHQRGTPGIHAPPPAGLPGHVSRRPGPPARRHRYCRHGSSHEREESQSASVPPGAGVETAARRRGAAVRIACADAMAVFGSPASPRLPHGISLRQPCAFGSI